ncbi:MAG: hypothetical protein KDG50_15970 [Chromatiales bacterium]|nr:hypothetical protein [Chromatiales bacterium]
MKHALHRALGTGFLPGILLAACFAPAAAFAATPLAEVRYSPDVTVTLGGVTLDDEDAASDDLGGTVTALDVGTIPGGADIVGYHALPNGDQLLAFDTTVTVGFVTAESRDVVRYDGVNFTIDFDGSNLGVPPGAQIDAIALGTDGALLLSFDTTVIVGAVTADDADIVRYDGAYSLFFDASAASVPDALDLDGAHVLANGHLLVSFDASESVGGVAFDDEDVIEYDPAGPTWEMAYDGSAEHATWAPADLDALAALEDPSLLPGVLQFSSPTYVVSEAGVSALITVTRTGGSAGSVSVGYQTADGSATAGADYSGVAGVLFWGPGNTASKTFNVPVTNDADAEGDETVNLALSAPTGGAAIGPNGAAILTIQDNDVPPGGALQFSAPVYSVNEGAGMATITVTRTGGSSGMVSVSYATADDVALDGSDYTAVASVLMWGDGDSAAKTFDVPITDDPDIEGDEPLNLSLSGPTGGAILGTQSTAVLSIVDNDIPPAGALQFSSPTYLVVEGVPSALITVTRTGGTSGPVSVMYATADGTAVNPDDYLNSFGVLNWPHGDGSNKTFIVPIVSDSYKELPETINLSLGGPTGGAVLGGIPTAILTIQDQPYPVPVFAPWTLLMLSGLLGLFGLRRTWSRRA